MGNFDVIRSRGRIVCYSLKDQKYLQFVTLGIPTLAYLCLTHVVMQLRCREFFNHFLTLTSSQEVKIALYLHPLDPPKPQSTLTPKEINREVEYYSNSVEFLASSSVSKLALKNANSH